MISQNKLIYRLRTVRGTLDKYLGGQRGRPVGGASRERGSGGMQRAVDMLRGALRR